MAWHDQDRELLRRLFDCAIEAVSPKRVIPACLPLVPRGRTILLAVGKGASAMADAAAAEWRGPLSGLVVTRYGHVLHSAGSRDIEVIEAGHPVPDGMSVVGARRAISLVQGLSADDLVLVLISGGGSSLWCLPIDGITLEDKQNVTTALLNAGSTINDLNTVRIGLSQIKGGKLAHAAWPARVETLIISDVVGDDPALIASGPTVPSSVSTTDVEKILARYAVEVPARVREALNRESKLAAVPKHQSIRSSIIATSADALRAAEREALASGYAVRTLGMIEGNASDAALAHAAIAREVAASAKPTIILSGGEITVTVRDSTGIGGPNTEFLLALAIALDGAPGIYALACDTDGYDGVGDNAGAMIGPHTLESARRENIDPSAALAGNDSYRFFGALGDLVVTGPTQTNVSDFRAILVRGRDPGHEQRWSNGARTTGSCGDSVQPATRTSVSRFA